MTGNAPLPSIRQVLREAESVLSGMESPRLDVEILLAAVLGVERSYLYARGESPVAAKPLDHFQELVKRRGAGEPVAYLTGSREFWSLPLKVNRTTLVPRPETECLVEIALSRLEDGRGLDVLDLGTGSGAIALAIASERPETQVLAVDISIDALELAAINADDLGVGNVRFQHSDWFSALADEQFDMLVCNPPYLCSADPALLADGLRHEPCTALDGGSEGLDAYAQIVTEAGSYLRRDAWLIFEHGSTQASAVSRLMEGNGYRDIFTAPDLAGLDRVTGGRRG